MIFKRPVFGPIPSILSTFILQYGLKHAQKFVLGTRSVVKKWIEKGKKSSLGSQMSKKSIKIT